jgi:proteasome activator subunit 4
MLEHEGLDDILAAIDPLLSDSDKFKQRGGAEILAGVLRGLLFQWHLVGYRDEW